MENSFYNLDYIIGLGEKRVDLYLSAYQGVLGRLTNIILIYSAIGIYLIPVIQDLIDGASPGYYIGGNHIPYNGSYFSRKYDTIVNPGKSGLFGSFRSLFYGTPAAI